MMVKEKLILLKGTVRTTLDRVTGAIDDGFHRALGHSKLGNRWYDFYDPNVKVLKDGQVVPRRNRLGGW